MKTVFTFISVFANFLINTFPHSHDNFHPQFVVAITSFLFWPFSKWFFVVSFGGGEFFPTKCVCVCSQFRVILWVLYVSDIKTSSFMSVLTGRWLVIVIYAKASSKGNVNRTRATGPPIVHNGSQGGNAPTTICHHHYGHHILPKIKSKVAATSTERDVIVPQKIKTRKKAQENKNEILCCNSTYLPFFSLFSCQLHTRKSYELCGGTTKSIRKRRHLMNTNYDIQELS